MYVSLKSKKKIKHFSCLSQYISNLPPILQNFKKVHFYSTISRGTPHDNLRNPGWETTK